MMAVECDNVQNDVQNVEQGLTLGLTTYQSQLEQHAHHRWVDTMCVIMGHFTRTLYFHASKCLDSNKV